jgi:hypothetical protein
VGDCRLFRTFCPTSGDNEAECGDFFHHCGDRRNALAFQSDMGMQGRMSGVDCKEGFLPKLGPGCAPCPFNLAEIPHFDRLIVDIFPMPKPKLYRSINDIEMVFNCDSDSKKPGWAADQRSVCQQVYPIRPHGS